MNTKFKLGFFALLAFLVWLLWPKTPATNHPQSMAENSESTKPSITEGHQKVRRHAAHEQILSQDFPSGTFEYVFDKAQNANRFLFGKGRDEKFRPHSDAPSGLDLWLQDESGNDRLLDGSVTRAKFSPDGNRIAFTTSDGVLHVQDLEGNRLAEVAGVYGPSWKPDSSTVIFSKVGEGQDPHKPGTRQLTAINIVTGKMESLTDGQFDDGRPEFNPSSEWVIFVSGARSGIASFWKVPAKGGKPVQLTNVGLREVNENFVPPPYDKTMWSADQRWFVYDFKSGDQQETWGLEFNADGTLKRANKLADGINPRWQDDGRTLVCEKTVDGSVQTIVSNLP